jgi:hypothetical protein
VLVCFGTHNRVRRDKVMLWIATFSASARKSGATPPISVLKAISVLDNENCECGHPSSLQVGARVSARSVLSIGGGIVIVGLS